MKNPIFLLSTGRTGTKYFSNFFSTYGVDVASYHTTSFTRLLNVLGNMYYYKLLSKNQMRTIWKRFKYQEIQAHDFTYIESNPYYYNMIDIISDVFPGAKFVFIVRLPKSFIISHIKWEKQRWQSMIANRLVPFWQPTSYLNQIRGFNNDYHQRVEFYSKIWVNKNTAILGNIAKNGNATVLKFEEVFHPLNGIQVMVRLVKWLNISLVQPITSEMITAKINKTNNVETNWWDNHCTEIVNEYCSSLMEEFEYSTCPRRISPNHV